MRPLWSVSWAPIAVVLAHSGLAAVVGHRREYDPWFHFLGGGAGADCLLRLLALFSTRFSRTVQLGPAAVVMAAMAAVAIVWEGVEFTSDRLLGTHVQLGMQDTLLDVLLGLLGAASVVGVWVLTQGRWNRTC